MHQHRVQWREWAGNALLGAPRLASQQADYLREQLLNFKAELRGYDSGDPYGAQMRAVTAALGKKEIERLSKYYANQEVALAALGT